MIVHEWKDNKVESVRARGSESYFKVVDAKLDFFGQCVHFLSRGQVSVCVTVHDRVEARWICLRDNARVKKDLDTK